MSHSAYALQWLSAMEELSEQIEIENPPPQFDQAGKQLPEQVISWDDAFQHYAVLYIRYTQIFRKLEDCYDQIVHPQKRRDIKLTMECVMARLCQVKDELVKVKDHLGPDGSQSDFLNLDELLLDLKLSPDALEIPLPRYFREKGRDDNDENQKRDILEKCFEEHGVTETQDEDGNDSLIPKMTKEQAIRIIQKNERGRQGLMRAKLMKELKEEEIMRRRLSAAGAVESDPNQSAIVIQKAFRGYLSRVRVRAQAQEELTFIGMAHPSKVDANGRPTLDPSVKERQIRRNRKTRQADNELKYVEALVELQQTVHDSEGPEMKDVMWDERYNWWIEQKEKTGKYPEGFDLYYKELELKANPPPVVPETPPEEEKKGKGKGKKDAKKPEGKGKSGKGKKDVEEKKPVDLLTTNNLIGPPEILNHMVEVVSKYKGVWSVLDESHNYHQNHDEGIARDMIRPMVREKIRKEVDVRLLAYLDNIKLKVQAAAAAAASGKRKGKKGSKKGKGSKKKGGGKKGSKKGGKKGSKKGGKGKKPKKCCDGEKAVSHMPLQDMVSVLVKMGILQQLRKPTKTMKNYLGDMNYLGSAYQATKTTRDPSMAQLRQCLTEYCVLPLGCNYVKQNSPLINAVLLYGPHGSGKTMLAKAIAAETAATWFDMSPRNVERKLGSKAEIAKLVHMVFKVAEELQPSVIYIDDVDKVWLQSKGKKSVSEIIKMKMNIMQHKGGLSKDKRVLVIGNARVPYSDKVDKKDLQKFFGYNNNGKMLFTPCPGYATRLKLWKHFIGQTGMNVQELEKNPKFDLTTLSYISEGYSAGNIQQAVQATLPERKVAKILESKKALDSSEFISALSKTSYTYKDEHVQFQKFTDEVTGEKARRKKLEEALEKQEEEAANTKGKNRPGKKKK